MNSSRKNAAIFIAVIAIGLIAAFQVFDFNFKKVPAKPIENSVSIITTPKPSRIEIKSLGVTAPITELGLNFDGTLEVPKKDDEVGWYRQSPTSGTMGPSVMVGHLDSLTGPAVFSNLKDIKIGDEVVVTRADGSAAIFKVDSKEEFSQDNFPTDKVYGKIDYAGLRLITCAGSFSRLEGHYSNNLVVFASLKSLN
jgi:sortase (surface protein transpeptidase)